MIDGLNMTRRELASWLRDPRNELTGERGAVGRLSLARLVRGDHLHDPAFARKVENFIRRHSRSSHLFGRPLQNSGFSARHIALLNWGHNPTAKDSPLADADAEWLDLHPEQRHARERSGFLR